MTADSPPLIGRSRPPQRIHSLGQAVPTMGSGRRRPGDPAPEKAEPKTREQIRAEDDARRDAQEAVTRCALCDWHFSGTVGEGRELARAHRTEQHPKAARTKTRRVALSGWTDKNPEQKAEAMVEVEKRRASAAAFDAREADEAA